jgi:2-phosphosulfolactate phosphatase
MRADVLLGEGSPTPSDVAGRVVVVIDVLRATTVMIQALSNGARAIVPCAEVADVMLTAQRYDRRDVCLAGERNSRPIEGFDLGNSPQLMNRDAVENRTVIMTTTNGTRALLGSHGAREVFVAAFVNLSATVQAIARVVTADANVVVVCAGQDRHFALEDAACAGVLLNALSRVRRGMVFGDAATLVRQLGRRYAKTPEKLARDAAHAVTLATSGFADDVRYCLMRDSIPLVATYSDRQVIRERILSPA